MTRCRPPTPTRRFCRSFSRAFIGSNTIPTCGPPPYVPHYNRFDTTEMRREPMEWNARASGHRLSDHPETTLWLLRCRYQGHSEGLVLQAGRVQRSNDAEELGYKPTR